LRSTDGWGIGDIGDLRPMSAWLAGAGQRVLQLLPLNEMAPGQQSPYSAISGMAIDPIYIRLQDVPEFIALGGREQLGTAARAQLEAVSASPRVQYKAVRALKHDALVAAFNGFTEREWRHDSARAGELRAFLSEHTWWLDDYALFRAIHRDQERPWVEWPLPLRRRDPEALERVRRQLSAEVLFYQYLQWIAAIQWRAARAEARTRGVLLFGDLSFMVDADSADVWSHQGDFRLDISIGVPPDAFSATGQDWGMPMYDWPAVAADSYRWLRERARRHADLYDCYRVDHVVGFYRTYGRPLGGGDPFFSPATEPDQEALGQTILTLLKDAGSEIVAEDLGLIPDFVRASLVRLGIPGLRVFRWERHWILKSMPFSDPLEYPQRSVATSGTHDTEPLAVWWQSVPDEERQQIASLASVQRVCPQADLAVAPYNPTVRDALLEALFGSASDLLLLPIPDVFGWTERINEPATVHDRNWTFRLPWPIDLADQIPELVERQATLLSWSVRHGRS
jgi:4-alpha-glucanotransferase